MKIAAVMYLDNQDVVGYPIKEVMESLKSFDDLRLFPADQANARAFEDTVTQFYRTRATLHDPTGIKITTPEGISQSMQNAFEKTRDSNSAPDFIVLVQADTLATDASLAAMKWFCTPENLDKAIHLNTQIALLHHYSGGGWGHTIVGRDWKGSFVEDGKGKDSTGFISTLCETNRTIGYAGLVNLEIGSMSVEHYYRHSVSNEKIWREPGTYRQRLEAYQRGDKDEFIRITLRDLRRRIHNTEPLTPANKIDFVAMQDGIRVVDTRYDQVIDMMGLRAEAEHCWAIGKEVEKEFSK